MYSTGAYEIRQIRHQVAGVDEKCKGQSCYVTESFFVIVLSMYDLIPFSLKRLKVGI